LHTFGTLLERLFAATFLGYQALVELNRRVYCSGPRHHTFPGEKALMNTGFPKRSAARVKICHARPRCFFMCCAILVCTSLFQRLCPTPANLRSSGVRLMHLPIVNIFRWGVQCVFSLIDGSQGKNRIGVYNFMPIIRNAHQQ
jgi:hypothetical protein